MGLIGARPPAGFTVVGPEMGGGATCRAGAGASGRSDAGTIDEDARALVRGSGTRRATDTDTDTGVRGDGVHAVFLRSSESVTTRSLASTMPWLFVSYPGADARISWI